MQVVARATVTTGSRSRRHGVRLALELEVGEQRRARAVLGGVPVARRVEQVGELHVAQAVRVGQRAVDAGHAAREGLAEALALGGEVAAVEADQLGRAVLVVDTYATKCSMSFQAQRVVRIVWRRTIPSGAIRRWPSGGRTS